MTDQGTGEELRGGHRDEAAAAGSGIDVVLVTGLSGAGRGTAAKVLEDLGWYVADNLPPELIAQMVDLGLAAGSRITQLAVVLDVRSRGFTGDLERVREIWRRGASGLGCCSWRPPTTSSSDATSMCGEAIRCRATRHWPKESRPSAGCWRRCAKAPI